MNNRSSKNNKARQSKINNIKSESPKPEALKQEAKNQETKNAVTTETNSKTNTLVNTNTNTTSNSENNNKQNNNNSQQKEKTKNNNTISAVIIIGTTILVAILATVLGGKMRDGLINPPAYPPEWLFPLMWSIFYILIGIASFLAFKATEGKSSQKNNMVWYGVHLFLNLLWPLFYFRLNLLIFSAIWLLAMVITSIVITYRYFRSKLSAGVIFTFYTLWLIYALYLNIGLAMLNAI